MVGTFGLLLEGVEDCIVLHFSKEKKFDNKCVVLPFLESLKCTCWLRTHNETLDVLKHTVRSVKKS